MAEITRLNVEELEAIRKRAEAATAGPWYKLFQYGISIVSESDYKVIDEDGGVAKYPDAEFIAHARQDVPKLTAEIERLRQALAEISDINEYASGNVAREALNDDEA